MREIDSEKMFQEVRPLANFPPNVHRITHSIEILKDWIGFKPLFQRPSYDFFP